MAKKIDTSPYNYEYRILAACWWHESTQTKTDMQQIRERLRERFDAEPPRGERIRGWETKLFENGTVRDEQRSGRPSSRHEHVDIVRQSVEGSPKTSTRRRSAQLGVPRTTLRKILKSDLQMKPYRPHFVQYLSDADYDLRVQNCQSILLKYGTWAMQKKLFFSDECAVYLSSKSKNLFWWSKENPHFYEHVVQHPPHVMVWAAMRHDRLFFFFLDGSVNQHLYQNLIRDKFIPTLQDEGIYQNCHFQQDGAPAHTAIATRDLLNEVFPNKWVGKYGPTPYPPRSPDLNSCDNSLWGILKHQVMLQKPRSKQELKDVISDILNNISTDTLERIHKRTFRMIQKCIDIQGRQVDEVDSESDDNSESDD